MTALFQFVISLFAAAVLFDLVRSYRQRKVSLWFAMAFGGAAIAMVVFVFMPSLADRLFSVLGIASGTNGSFFLAICGLIYVVKRQFQMISELKRQQTEIVRRLALDSEVQKQSDGME